MFKLLSLFACVSLVAAHGVILAAQGEPGSPPSVGFQVDPNLARNCTSISPCQQDTTIIRDAEIEANIVNECGRTELTGNIDVGENTENALAAKAVTSVKAGTLMTVTIHQVNADGAGPYTCDLDQTSNTGVISQNLSVTNNVPGANGLSQAKFQDFNITVAMPENLACSGASTGNVCTVRCRNNALAGPFGGCFPVQQTDVTPSVNNANTIDTAQTLSAINSQIQENQADLPAAVAANQNAGTTEAENNLAVANALVGATVTTKASAQQTVAVDNVGTNAAAATDLGSGLAGATATTAAAKGQETSTAASAKSGNGNGNGNGNGKGKGGKAPAADQKGGKGRRALRFERRSLLERSGFGQWS